MNNVLLIALQAPEATRVAGYRTWQGLGRQVKRGERGIRILAPVTRKVTDEESGEEARRVVFFKSVSVFDIAQTEGDELPEVPCHLLQGEAPSTVWNAVADQIAAAGFGLERGSCAGGANGQTDYATKTVRVRDDVEPAQATKTLIHELGHVLLHQLGDDKSREQREVEAESVAFMVCTALGIDAGAYSFGYVAGWSDADHDLIEKTANLVMKTARRILEATGAATSDSEEVAA